MGLLNEIFSNVVFSEIDPLFDGMEKAFLLLMEGYELNMPEEATDNGIYCPNTNFRISFGKSVKLDKVLASRCKAHCLDTMRSNLRMYKHDVAELA